MTSVSFDLTGRSAIVIGGTSGINLGVARAFAASGARVFVVSRDPDKVAAAVAMLRELGQADGTAADVRDYDAVAAVAARAAEPGPLDIVVSGAAGNFVADASAMSANGFRTVIDIDLIGTFHAARACFAHLRSPGSSVINITAPQGVKPILGQAHACAAKAGVNMLTKCLALEWGPLGIRVNAISPGPIADTEGMRRLAPDAETTATIANGLPLKRFGEIDEIASAACYLASDAASYVTGLVMDVDGGTVLGSGALA